MATVTGLLITNGGAAAIAADLSGGADLALSHVAFGDANGVPYNPVTTQVALVNERYRATIASVAVVDGAIVVDAIIPADTNDASGRASHSFSVAECGLFSSAGALIGVARMGNGYKPGPASGQAVVATYRLKLAVANPSAISVVIDPQSQLMLGRNVRVGWLTVDGVLNAPPANPAVGATYVIGTAPTGAWAGFAGRLAQWVGVWSLAICPIGHVVRDNSRSDLDPLAYLRLSAGGWVSALATQTIIGVTRRATAAEILARTSVDAFVSPADTLVPVLAPRTLYVRPDGNDLNDGSANTAAAAFKTIGGALAAAIRTFSPSKNQITIQISDGTYIEAVAISRIVGLRFRLLGNSASPQNVIVRAPVGSTAAIIGETLADIDLDGMQVEAAAGAPNVNGIMALDRSRLNYRNIRFGAGAAYQVFSARSSVMTQDGPVTVLAGSGAHIVATSQGSVNCSAQAITYVGTPAFSVANVWSNNGTVHLPGATLTGAATGPRYQADVIGLIWTGGAGVNFIPGSAAGAIYSGGYYG